MVLLYSFFEKSLGLSALIELLQPGLFPSHWGLRGKFSVEYQAGSWVRGTLLFFNLVYGLQNSKGERFRGILKTWLF